MARIFTSSELTPNIEYIDFKELMNRKNIADLHNLYEKGTMIILSNFKLDYDQDIIDRINFPADNKKIKKNCLRKKEASLPIRQDTVLLKIIYQTVNYVVHTISK
ncbi:MAG: hypothetical protein O7D86_13650 [Proteobacteria bacterium]|nr:hypothetical protein [Pseudomonadota bacterium]